VVAHGSYVTLVAIEMHNSFDKQEVSKESRQVIGSLWLCLPSRRYCAL
jgi:hypothetical protein